MRDRVQTLANRLLDAAVNQGSIDLIRDYALPVPTTIIAEMLGIPVNDRHASTGGQARSSRAVLPLGRC